MSFATPRLRTLLPVLGLLAMPAFAADDNREMVELPPMMQDHMLSNMRDHLRAIEEILDYLADANASEAGKVAENRLGLSSLDTHGASHLAPYMPEGMAAAGTEMHRAASRFVIAAQDAELDTSPEAQRAVYGALSEVTAACNACHQSYKIR